MTAEQMLGSIIVVIIMLLPTVLSVYNIVKTRQDKEQGTLKENTAVITELNTTMRTLNSVISELKIDYKNADEKLATHLKEHDKTL